MSSIIAVSPAGFVGVSVLFVFAMEGLFLISLLSLFLSGIFFSSVLFSLASI